ncbi:MAG: RNA methyltransferase, partial [Burkholderiales bacterium]|nr:RNA methyltransferase [Burkholderiales bacterium]
LRLLIGPEGGFSPTEQDWLVRDPGARSISLGPWILRAETAAIVACGLAVQSYLGSRN